MFNLILETRIFLMYIWLHNRESVSYFFFFFFSFLGIFIPLSIFSDQYKLKEIQMC